VRAPLLPPALQRRLAERHGVVTTADLKAAGLGKTTITRLVEAGVLRRLIRGVFALTTAPPTLEHRCRVLCVLHPAGFVTGPTAAILAGLRRQPVSSALHFSVRHGARLDGEPGVEFHQTTKLAAADRRLRPDGIVVASWPRLAFDLAAHLRQLDHRSVIQQLLDRELVTVAELVATGARLCHPARSGSGTYERTLSALGRGPAQDSHAEVVLRDSLLALGVPVEPQVAIGLDGTGRALHVDLGVDDVRWGVELDIHPEHRSVEGHQRDAIRRRIVHRGRWQVELVTELDMADVPALSLELATLYRHRRQQFDVA